MNTLRQHISTLVVQKQIHLRSDFAAQFNKIVFNRLMAVTLLVFLLQYIGLSMSTLQYLFSPLWLASGTACALIFSRGCRILPGLWLGSLFAYFFANVGVLVAAGCATLYTLQAYLILQLSYRYSSPILIFYQRKLFFNFIVLGLVTTAVVSYCLAIILFPKINHHVTLMQIWLQWWSANFNGLFIFGCAVVTWDVFFPQLYLLNKSMKSVINLFGAIFILCVALLFVHQGLAFALMAFLLLILTGIVSIKFKWCGLVSALFIQGFILSFAGFVNGTLLPSSFAGSLILQGFLFSEICLGLFSI